MQREERSNRNKKPENVSGFLYVILLMLHNAYDREDQPNKEEESKGYSKANRVIDNIVLG